MSFITLEQAFDQWESEIKPLIIAKYGENDTPALSESWNDYADSLCKDGQLSELQYRFCPAFDSEEMPFDDKEYILKQLGINSGDIDKLIELFDYL